MLAHTGKSVEDTLLAHWGSYGRNFFTRYRNSKEISSIPLKHIFTVLIICLQFVCYRYDYENCASDPCNEMMKKLEELITSPSFPGTKYSNGGKTYVVKEGDNYAYTDPIDKSFASKQVIMVIFVSFYVVHSIM